MKIRDMKKSDIDKTKSLQIFWNLEMECDQCGKSESRGPVESSAVGPDDEDFEELDYKVQEDDNGHIVLLCKDCAEEEDDN